MMRWIIAAGVFAIAPASADPIQSVLAHPPVDASFKCSEHWEGQFEYLGDALGKDCVVQRLTTVDGRTWMRSYEGDGAENSDWYGWHKELLSPCACEVIEIHRNEDSNEPGEMQPGRAASIVLRKEDGTHFTLAHVRNVAVETGEQVSAGQPLAMIGNNGYSRHPHVHIGAWRDDEPLQIRFNQSQMRMPPQFREDEQE
jgi:hypothetical protein